MSAASLTLEPELLTHLVPARRLEERRGFLPTGVPALDHLLAGGWPRGRLSEITGRRSTGRTSLELAALAAAQRRGETVTLVDVGGGLDPRGAGRAGVLLPSLLWVRCGSKEALAAADLLVAAGGFGLVVVDMGDGPTTRVPDSAWVRLARGAERQGTTVLVATPRRAVGTFATVALSLGDARVHFAGGDPEPWLLCSIESRALLERARLSASPSAEPARLGFEA